MIDRGENTELSVVEILEVEGIRPVGKCEPEKMTDKR